MQPKFLKTPRGDVIGWSAIQAAKAGNVPCNAEGQIQEIDGVTESINLNAAAERLKTPFLGNPETGALLPYTDILAEREDLLSMRSEEEWSAYMAAQPRKDLEQAPPEPPRPKSPALTRETESEALMRDDPNTPVGSMTPTEDDKREDIDLQAPSMGVTMETPSISPKPQAEAPKPSVPPIPKVGDMSLAEAKKALSDWADSVGAEPIDRRKGLNTLLGECEQIFLHVTTKGVAA